MVVKVFFSVFFSIVFVFLAVFAANCVYGHIFPIKYQDEIASASIKYHVDEAIIYSIINTESHFRKDAVSAKGAVGLMQILPTTAQEIAKQEDFDLKIPKDNINLGTCYFAQLLSRFEVLETALCAYNAGPTNVNKWLADKEMSQDGKNLKKIPFAETRGYVEKFRKNLKYYSSKI